MEWKTDKLAAWYESPAGRKVAGAIGGVLANNKQVVWPAHGLRPLVLEVGYAAPYLLLWPNALADHTNPATLGEDGRMECRYDRLVVAHALENPTHDAETLLARCWQALRPDGVMVVIVPASYSLCRLGNGPFAAGRCFTSSRLQLLLQQAGFKPFTLSRVSGTLVAVVGKQVSGTKVLAREPATGRLVVASAGV